MSSSSWWKIFYDDWNNIKNSFISRVVYKLFLTQFSFNSRWVQTVHESVLKYCLIETDPLTSSRAFRQPTSEVRFRPDQIADCRPVQTRSFIRQKGKSISRGSYRIRNALQSFASVGHCYQLENSIPSIFGLTHILTILNSIIRYRINQITVSKAHKMLLFDELCSLLHNPHMGEQLSGAWQTFKLKTLKTSRFRERASSQSRCGSGKDADISSDWV